MPAKGSNRSLDRAGRSELHYAVADGKLERVKELVQQGMEVNFADRNGWTSLHFAAQNNDVETARFLLDSGAAVDPRDCYGNTPLFRAVFNSRGNGDLIALLRHHGADPESKNNSGVSPVGLARTIGNYNIAQFFDDLEDAPETRVVSKATGKMMEQPFLEHPNGEHESAVDAIEHTIRKLRELPELTQWLTLCAQGAGASEDSVHSAEVRILEGHIGRRRRVERD